MIELWRKNKILFVFIIAIILLFPTALSKESIAYTHLICVSMGIDKIIDEYEVSLQVVVPKQSNAFNQTLKVISAKGGTIKDAIEKIKYHSGKDIGFAQCGFIVFNEELAKENILLPIDYLVRTHNVNYNCILFCTDKSANKILELNEKYGQSYSFNLNRILENNENTFFATNTNIESAYKSYLSYDKSFAISLITTSAIKSDGVDGENSSNSDKSGGDNDANKSGKNTASGKDENILSNKGEIVFFKSGKFIAKFKNEDVVALNYLKPNTKNINILVKDFTSGIFDNAIIELSVAYKKSKCDYKIINNKLMIKSDILMDLKIDDIKQNEDYEKFLNPTKNYLTKDLIEKIKIQEKNRFLESVKKIQAINLDVINVYTNFNRYLYKDFQNYLKNADNKENYLQNVVFDINFEIITR